MCGRVKRGMERERLVGGAEWEKLQVNGEHLQFSKEQELQKHKQNKLFHALEFSVRTSEKIL